MELNDKHDEFQNAPATFVQNIMLRNERPPGDRRGGIDKAWKMYVTISLQVLVRIKRA